MTQPGLLDRVRAEIPTCHYSCRTGQAYVLWIRKFIRFNELRGAKWLMASLIYGAGLRLWECARVSADYASLIRPTRT